MAQDPRDPHYSPDGFWWWDGSAWRPVAAQQAPASSGGMSSGSIVALVAGIVIVTIVLVSVFAVLAFQRISQGLPRSISINDPVVAANGVPCDRLEHTQVHYHAALQIIDAGANVAVPTGLGRTVSCYYWLHMHTGEPGIIHIEAPSDRAFTLGDFFQVWGEWSGEKQLLDSTHVSTLVVGAGQMLAVFVDTGGGAKAYTGNPRDVVLAKHEVITLEITPPAVNPPPAFVWPAGF